MANENMQHNRRSQWALRMSNKEGVDILIDGLLTAEQADVYAEISNRNYHKNENSDHNVRIECYEVTNEEAEEISTRNKGKTQDIAKLFGQGDVE